MISSSICQPSGGDRIDVILCRKTREKIRDVIRIPEGILFLSERAHHVKYLAILFLNNVFFLHMLQLFKTFQS